MHQLSEVCDLEGRSKPGIILKKTRYGLPVRSVSVCQSEY